MIKIIGTVLQIIMAVIKIFREKNAEKKIKKGEALKEVIDGMEKDDASAVNRGIGKLNRL